MQRSLRSGLLTGLACLLLAGTAQRASADEPRDTSPIESLPPGLKALAHLQQDDLAAALQDLTPITRFRGFLIDAGVSAAAGGLHRALVQVSTDEQYDLLAEWSLPDESRPEVRILALPVPRHAPPRDFARLLGQRPRDTSFPIAEVGGVSGLFCTGWMLVQAADDIGRLRRLTTELEALVDQNVPQAATLLAMARIADPRSDPQNLLADLASRRIAAPADGGATGAASLTPVNLAVIAAALDREELRPLAEEILAEYIDASYEIPDRRITQLLRVVHATAVQRHRGESGPEVLWTNRLKYWIPASGMTSTRHAAGTADAMWLVHEDHILHLSGAGNDVLFFRYPLTGHFQFTCETQEGGRMGTDGGLVYGGLQFEALGSNDRLTVWDADLFHQTQKLCPFVRHEEQPTFNRVSIRSNDEGTQFLANLHPVWFDSPAARTSPWLGLRSQGAKRPVFRNFQLTGSPEIPAEVPLVIGDQLRGWRSGFFGETQPPFVDPPAVDPSAEQPLPVGEVDWSIAEGELQASRREGIAAENAQSLLAYQRPLLDGESVRYEFFYEPDEVLVHPALGRLAFLIEPTGIRVHWITDAVGEWSGLPVDNALLEPLNRRGPTTLPLQASDWNRMTFERADGRIRLHLNEELIYERPVDFGGDLAFGFYRDRMKHAVRIRNVVMTGDWPKTVPEEFLQNPATLLTSIPSADLRAAHRTLGENIVAANVRAVRQHAGTLPPDEQFTFLADWVFPTVDHSDIRLAGRFVPSDPSPAARALAADIAEEGVDQNALLRGARLQSPLFDLLDVADRSGRLDELQQRCQRLPSYTSNPQQRARLALTALIDLERGDIGSAAGSVATLRELASGRSPQSLADQWPETLTLFAAIERYDNLDLVGDLLLQIYNERTRPLLPAGISHWHTHIAAFTNRYRNTAMGRTGVPIGEAPDDDWVAATRQRYLSRGTGSAPALWRRIGDNELLHWSGHQEELLLYRCPLRGEFEVECDIGSYGTQVLAGGRFCGPNSGGDKLQTGTFRQGMTDPLPIDPPLSKLDEWVRYRAVFDNETCTIFINGKQVHKFPLTENDDPWFGLRCWWRSEARLRDLRITGKPSVPTAVNLSTSIDLTGWLPYFGESSGYVGAVWEAVADPLDGQQIVGHRIGQLNDTWTESLLRYHRPLIEDGSIEYEFRYEPGRTITHPALDRLVFLLTPEGVRVHWVTDGPCDPTNLPPDNATSEPANQRGATPLPLIVNAWNHLRLTLEGNRVLLTLNNQLVYERELNAGNQRTFGLFRYAETEVRVRNVVMRGDWPHTIPPVSEQPWADPQIAQLDARIPELQDVFTWQFTRGLEPRFFTLHNQTVPAQISLRNDGLHLAVSSSGKWTQVAVVPRFTLHGDFDLEARFSGVQFVNPDNQGHVQLMARLQDDHNSESRISRGRGPGGREHIKGQLSLGHPDGTRRYIDTTFSHHAASGRLRLVRHGRTLYTLLAEGDSDNYRLIGTETASEQSTIPEGVRLLAVANVAGTTRVVFDEITLRAERLTLAADKDLPPQRPLYVMNVDGSDLQQLTLPLQGYSHLGSPEWSPDGERIALDMSTGSTTTSHIVVVPLDGSPPRDLGPGCMPSYSADGTQIVFSQPGDGIVTMNADGTNRQTLDSTGWGAQWSPDGQSIAFGRSANVILIAPRTKRTRTLLTGDDAGRYGSVYWNLGWSRDSRMIAFKGRNRQTGQDEVGLIRIAPRPALSVLYATDQSIQADFTFSPDNRQVLFATHSHIHRGPALFTIDTDDTDPPRLFAGQPTDLNAYNCAWSPNGQQIAFSSQLPLKEHEWPLKTESATVPFQRETNGR